MKPELTEEELQMIEIIREWTGAAEYRLLIEREDGAWNITLSEAPHDQGHTARGTGASFNDAWNDMAPSAA